MKSHERTILIKEFEQYLNSKYLYTKEAVYTHFMPTKRQFRADYFVRPNILIEINGGQFINGRHNRGGVGYETDLYKLNLAQKCGYVVYQFTYEMLKRQTYLDFI